MAAITVPPIPAEHLGTIAEELEVMARHLRMMMEPSFWERYERGVEQIARGDCITLEDLIERYEVAAE